MGYLHCWKRRNDELLSKEATQFILELKMYLMSKGKNDKEINDVIEELSDHLLQAESEGKNIKDIIGDSPQAYMKSIGQEMEFDRKEFFILTSMSALLIMAYFCFTPAILGEFSLSKLGVFGAIFGAVLTFILYGFLLVKVLPKMFYSKWFYVLVGLVYALLTGFFLLVLLFDKEPFFIATPLQNNIILIGCILIFIIFSIYAKSWISIVIPFFMSLGPLAERFVPESINEDPFYITLAIIVCTLFLIVGFYFLFKKRKKKSRF